MANKTAREVLKEHLVLPVLKLKETHPHYFITEKGYEELIDQALHSLCNLIIEGMDKEIACVCGLGDKDPRCICGALLNNLALSSCKESVRKSLEVEK